MFHFYDCFLIFSLIITLCFSTSYAEITLDGSFGNAGEVSLLGQNYDIQANFGKVSGNNLFHSFGKFNVDTGETVTFHAPNQIENIISRITGGEQSFIDGTLMSPTNLYLLNPYGFMLGRNARLNVNGSFHLSSADYLRFADGLRFEARVSTSPLLSVATPEAFGFLGNPLGNITINGSILEVPEGKDLSVIGGDITLQRDEKFWKGVMLTAPSGRIQIASVASAGELAQSNIINNTLTRLGNVAMMNNGLINAGNNNPHQAGGTITIQSGQIVMSDFIVENGGNNGSGDIQIVSTKEFRMVNNSRIQTRTKQGQAGNIILRGQQLDISEGSAIFSLTEGMKPAGNIIMIAKDSIVVTGIKSMIANVTTGTGKGGNIELHTNNLNIQQGSIVTTESGEQGKAGNIYINVEKILLSNSEVSSSSYNIGKTGKIVFRVSGDLQIDAGLIEAVTFKQGDADNIELKVGNLILTNGAQVNASSEGVGKGGQIDIKVKGAIDISGFGYLIDPATGKISNKISPSGITSSTFSSGSSGTIQLSAHTLNLDKWSTIQTLTKGDGNAGDIIIDVHDLRITNGADIDASNEGTGSGKGGNIKITATNSVLITAFPSEDEFQFVVKDGFLGGIYSIANNRGIGGNITLSTKQLILRNGGVISAGSEGTGNAGNLTFNIGGELNLDNAAIFTRAKQAGGGNIQIHNPPKIHLNNSEITARAEGLERDDRGGNVTINNQDFFTLNTSRVLASAIGGDGGNIQITSNHFLQSSDSLIDASSELGIDGLIQIDAPETKIGDEIVVLPKLFASPPLSNACETQLRENNSGFIRVNWLRIPRDELDGGVLGSHYDLELK